VRSGLRAAPRSPPTRPDPDQGATPKLPMPIDLSEIAAPARTAVLTMEVQRGTVGEHSPFPDLVRAAADAELVPNICRLLDAARQGGVRVVHCTARFRRDLAGSKANAPLLSAMMRRPDHILEGSPGEELCDGMFDSDWDLVCPRLSGVSPFTGTSLDSLLRNMGVETVVATGVSVNLAILGLCIEAVNLGYKVVLPVDAVAGFPAEYVEAVIANTLSLVATKSTVDAMVKAWRC
jgi:nicotinamidase-related amidase